jgi:hypothetical protein
VLLGDLDRCLFRLFVRFFAFFARRRRVFAELLDFGFVVFAFELADEVSDDAAVGLRRPRDFVRARDAEGGEPEHGEQEDEAGACPRLGHRGQSRPFALAA